MNNTIKMRQILNQLNEAVFPIEYKPLIKAASSIQQRGVFNAAGINGLLDFLEILEQYPEWKEKHEVAKQTITQVYRGIGFGSGDAPRHRLKLKAMNDKKKMIMADKKEFLSTSSDKDVAWRFVHQSNTGFDEEDFNPNDEKRKIKSDYGFLSTYKVTPDAILMVVGLFEPYFKYVQMYGQELGEAEVIINDKAQLIDIFYFAKSDDEYAWDKEDEEEDFDDEYVGPAPPKVFTSDEKKIENTQLSAFLSNPPMAIRKFNKTGETLSPKVRLAIVNHVNSKKMPKEQLAQFLKAINYAGDK